MNENPLKKYIKITSFKDENIKKVFYNRRSGNAGRIYCYIGAAHRLGHPLNNVGDIPWDNQYCLKFCKPHEGKDIDENEDMMGKPLLFVDSNLKIVPSPTASTLSFIMKPTGEIIGIKNRSDKNSDQMEFAEAVVICGICHKRDRELHPRNDEKNINFNNFKNISFVSLINKKYSNTPNQGILNKRATEWFGGVSRIINDSMENMRAWMLKGVDGISEDEKTKLLEEGYKVFDKAL